MNKFSHWIKKNFKRYLEVGMCITLLCLLTYMFTKTQIKKSELKEKQEAKMQVIRDWHLQLSSEMSQKKREEWNQASTQYPSDLLRASSVITKESK